MQTIAVRGYKDMADTYVKRLSEKLKETKNPPQCIFVVLPGQKTTQQQGPGDSKGGEDVWRAVRKWAALEAGLPMQCVGMGKSLKSKNKSVLRNVVKQAVNKLGIATAKCLEIPTLFKGDARHVVDVGAASTATDVMVCGIAVDKKVLAFTFTLTSDYNNPCVHFTWTGVVEVGEVQALVHFKHGTMCCFTQKSNVHLIVC
jgi:hypothetical protein